jgi:hypothetical protein
MIPNESFNIALIRAKFDHFQKSMQSIRKPSNPTEEEASPNNNIDLLHRNSCSRYIRRNPVVLTGSRPGKDDDEV